MALITFSANAKVRAADLNANFEGLADGSNIGTGAIITAKLADSAVTAAKLATDAVETAKIKDANVTAGKLATSAIFLGYAAITADTTTTSTSSTLVTGLSATVTVPSGGRRVKITVFASNVRNQTAAKTAYLEIWDGTVGSGTKIAQGDTYGDGTDEGCPFHIVAVQTPSAGSKTYNVGFRTDSGGTTALAAASTAPAFILVELI